MKLKLIATGLVAMLLIVFVAGCCGPTQQDKWPDGKEGNWELIQWNRTQGGSVVNVYYDPTLDVYIWVSRGVTVLPASEVRGN